MSLISDGTLNTMLRTGWLKVTTGKDGGDLPMPSMIQPASIDVQLDHLLKECWTKRDGKYAMEREERVPEMELGPNGFVLGSTVEWVELPDNLAMKIEGKSSLARLGLQIESAGFIDPGFNGNITLEIKNLHPFRTIHLHRGMKIAQVRFAYTDAAVRRPYGHPGLGSHYQGQEGATQSWLA